MFGELSGMEAEEVRIAMLNEITTNYEWYEHRCVAVLHQLDMSFSGWLGKHMKKNVRADCITLFALSVMYDQHTIVYNSKMPWCTKKWFGREGEGNLFTACHIHLLYIGDNMFVILRPIQQQSTTNHVSLSSLIPGCTVDVFSSNTETHVEYQFDAPDMTSNNDDMNNDCCVVDYYPNRVVSEHGNPVSHEVVTSDEDCIPLFPAFDEEINDEDDGPIEKLSDRFHIHQQEMAQECLEQDKQFMASSGIKNTSLPTVQKGTLASSGSNNTSPITVCGLPASSGFNNTLTNTQIGENATTQTVPVDNQAIWDLVSDK